MIEVSKRASVVAFAIARNIEIPLGLPGVRKVASPMIAQSVSHGILEKALVSLVFWEGRISLIPRPPEMLVWLHRFLVFRLARVRRPSVTHGIIETQWIPLVFWEGAIQVFLGRPEIIEFH